ncbi:MAG TPA: HEAT repeat domain-containing protein [Thermoanaerobaculia bacterium]|nr:HEAT repeat domain-containing protein [Thermoanaerobaculia bacterium]
MSSLPTRPWWRPELRAGEGPLVTRLVAMLLLLVVFETATGSVRQAAFLDDLGATRLPLAYLLLAIVSFPVLRLIDQLSHRVTPGVLLAGSGGVAAASLIPFWGAWNAGWTWLPMAFYVWISLVQALLLTLFWSLAARSFDSRQARRLFALVAAGGLLGGVLGGQLTRWAAGAVGSRHLLLGAAVLPLVVAALGLAGRRPAPPAAPPPGREEVLGGITIVRASHHLRLLTAVTLLGVVVAQAVDLMFNWAVDQAVGGTDQLTAFFGSFASWVALGALVFQVVAVGPLLRRLGVGFALSAVPWSLSAGTAAFLAAAALAPGLLVPAALILKGVESGLRFSLRQTVHELLFFPVPEAWRTRVKAVIDLLVQRSAKGLAAILLLPVAWGWMAPLHVAWLAAAALVVWVAVARSLHRAYAGSFRDLLSREPSLDVPELSLADATALEVLLQALSSNEPQRVLHSLRLLELAGRGNLVHPLLLYHDDPRVRQATLGVLARADRTDALPLIERRLGDEDPDVRAEAARALAELEQQELPSLMLPRLRDVDPAVRAAAVAALATYGDPELEEMANQALEEMTSDAGTATRAEAARALGMMPEPRHRDLLVQLLADGAPEVATAALAAVRRRAVRDGFVPVYTPSAVSLLASRRVRNAAREALVGLGPPVLPLLRWFLDSDDEPPPVRQALPRAIAAIGGDEARRILLDRLGRPAERRLRRALIEALGELDLPPGDAAAAVVVEQAAVAEARTCLDLVTLLWGLGVAERSTLQGWRLQWHEDERPSLLERMLAERLGESVRNLFGLAGLLAPAGSVGDAYRTLVRAPLASRSHALEYLDNTLPAAVRRQVMAVVDEVPLAAKVAIGRELFGIAPRPAEAVLGRLLAAGLEAEPDGCALALAALYEVRCRGASRLAPAVEALRQDAPDPVVRETAEWVASRYNARVVPSRKSHGTDRSRA